MNEIFTTVFKALKPVLVLSLTMSSHWAGGWPEKSCPDCVSDTISCRKSIFGADIWLVGSRCAMSWWDFSLIFDLAVVTLTLKILSGLYFGKR